MESTTEDRPNRRTDGRTWTKQTGKEGKRQQPMKTGRKTVIKPNEGQVESGCFESKEGRLFPALQEEKARASGRSRSRSTSG